MDCPERERLKEEVVRTARLYMEAVDFRSDAHDTPEIEPARRRVEETRRAYEWARTELEKHGREHGCLP